MKAWPEVRNGYFNKGIKLRSLKHQYDHFTVTATLNSLSLKSINFLPSVLYKSLFFRCYESTCRTEESLERKCRTDNWTSPQSSFVVTRSRSDMNSFKFAASLLAVLAVFGPGPCQATLTLPKIFGDGMVLQSQPSQAHIWGKSDVEGDVTVNLGCQEGSNFAYKAKPVSCPIS